MLKGDGIQDSHRISSAFLTTLINPMIMVYFNWPETVKVL